MGDPRYRLRAAFTQLRTAVVVIAAIVATTSLVRPASAGFATLVWTSPADFGGASVSAYDVRISTRAIAGTDTVGWWSAATRISMTGKQPAAPGTIESLLLGGLVNGARYYAILRSRDAANNWSSYSNVATFMPVTAITGIDEEALAPSFVLGIPRPTPTSGRADVNLELPKSAEVTAAVFDARGRLVRTLEGGTMSAGMHVLHWDGRLDGGGDAASGVYWIRVAAGSVTKRVKLVVAK